MTNAPAWRLSPVEARAVLRLDPLAGPRAIRRAFARAVKAAHPDRPGGNVARFRLVVEAYQLLMTPSLVPAGTPESAARQHLRRFAAAWAA